MGAAFGAGAFGAGVWACAPEMVAAAKRAPAAMAANTRPRGKACAAKIWKFIVENPFWTLAPATQGATDRRLSRRQLRRLRDRSRNRPQIARLQYNGGRKDQCQQYDLTILIRCPAHIRGRFQRAICRIKQPVRELAPRSPRPASTTRLGLATLDLGIRCADLHHNFEGGNTRSITYFANRPASPRHRDAWRSHHVRGF